jgi:hypothetical protein
MSANRSPRYPYVDLAGAIEMVEKVFDKEGRAPVKEEVAVKHMGYGGLNGSSAKALSALRKYGLVEDVSGGVKVSQDAILILANRHQIDSPDRVAAIRRAAFRVELFATIHENFGTDPSEQNLAAQLVVRGFSQDGALKAARTYRATMALVGGDDLEETFSDKRGSNAAKESSMEQVHQHSQSPHQSTAAIVAIAADEREWLRGPLSREASYRLVVSGEMGPRELGKLIKLLEAQRAVLQDDDEDD